jgi:hypothetical protein
VSRLAGRLTPPVVKRAVGRTRAVVVRAKVLGDLQRIARSGRPIIAGPWLGEVGFELLYWVPFLRWAIATFAIDPARVIAVSRGGPVSWYAGMAARYVDVLDVMTLDAFRDGNDRRRAHVGEQKQLHATPFDEAVAQAVAERAAMGGADVLHPSLMYRLMRPYWWKHAGESWVFRHVRLAAFDAPPLPAGFDLAPGQYVAARFYFNDCVADTPRVREACTHLIQAVAARVPVVSLTTDLALDDHASTEVSGARSIAGLVTPRNNLEVQTAVVAHARAFIGTYGGFSYLAPLARVPARAFYSKADGYDRAHLQIARGTIARLRAPSYEVADLTTTDAETMADQVVGLSGAR